MPEAKKRKSVRTVGGVNCITLVWVFKKMASNFLIGGFCLAEAGSLLNKKRRKKMRRRWREIDRVSSCYPDGHMCVTVMQAKSHSGCIFKLCSLHLKVGVDTLKRISLNFSAIIWKNINVMLVEQWINAVWFIVCLFLYALVCHTPCLC